MHPASLLARIDARLGDGLEHALCRLHAARLARLGWSRALDPPDGELLPHGSPPPRPGTDVEVLIDGAQAFPDMLEHLARARSHVHLTGWHLQPGLSFGDDAGAEARHLRDVLVDCAARVDVRLLIWGGSPMPAVHPTRRAVQRLLSEFNDTKVTWAVDRRERPMHCHHEKTLVIDDEVAWVGGLDLTDFGGNRNDRQGHPLRDVDGWHDLAARLRGSAVLDVARHFHTRWSEITGELLPDPHVPEPVGSSTVQIVRTVPETMYDRMPRGDFRILEAYVRGLRSAQRFIYLENQFLWSPEIVSVLADKLHNPPHDDFRLVVVLPGHPVHGGDDTRGQLGVLREADDRAGRLVACSLNAVGEGASRPVYVHAKVAIVDDCWLTLGSANLNERSLFNDSELNIVTTDADLARDTRLRLWAEHLGCDQADVAGDVHDVVDQQWTPVAREQQRRREQGLPLTRHISSLPHVSRRSDRLRGPLQGMLVDG